ncbi:MAG: DUF58 domain-containing protein [Anaerolineales bacterium]
MTNLLVYVVVLFIVAAVFRVDFFFYVLYFLFGVYLLARIWAEQALKRVNCTFQYAERVFPGERTTVHLTLTNTSPLVVPWLRLHESTPVQLRSSAAFEGVLSLRPFERRELSYDLDCRNRGYYVLGPLTVESGDLFGFQRYRHSQETQRVLLVYPHVVPLTRLGLPAQSPFGSIPVKDRLYEDPTRLIGVREYVPGDSMRRIHWRTSAATGKLQVKRFEPAISIEGQIILDLRRDDYALARFYSASELGIVAAASFAAHLIEARQSAGLACNALDAMTGEEDVFILAPGRGQRHLMQMLDLLARVKLTTNGPSFSETLRRASLGLSWGATAIVILPDVTEELFGVFLWMKQRGLHLTVIVTDPHQAFSSFQARAAQVGIHAHLVWQERDLDAWREAQET